MTEVQKLQLITGETNTELLNLLLEDAEQHVLAYTGRTRLPPALQKTVRDLAVIALNRIGTEGETGRSEGGESYSFAEAPKQIYNILNKYRLARVGGIRHEAKKKQTEAVHGTAEDSEAE